MSYTYATFVTALASEMGVSESDADFVVWLPSVIDHAEQRIYRELDLLAALFTTSGTLTANTRSFTLPTTNGHVLEVSSINIIDTSSVRHRATPATRDAVETLWPSETAAAASTIPEMFARVSDTAVLFGPPPGSNWSCEVIHTARPANLSAGNTTTWIGNYLPDLFFAAAMVTVAGWEKNFSAMADDPAAAVSWEAHYQRLKASALTEEMRKKYASVGGQ